jgi:signal recognition particle GTPase
MERLEALSTYTLGDHLGLLEAIADKAGAKGWRTMLLTAAQKSDLEEQLVDLKLSEALTPAEKDNVKLIDGAARLRAAAQIGVPVARVNKFLDGYAQSATIHTWLRGRKAAGKALPRTMEEYVNTMLVDKVGLNAEMLKKTNKKAKNQKTLIRRM